MDHGLIVQLINPIFVKEGAMQRGIPRDKRLGSGRISKIAPKGHTDPQHGHYEGRNRKHGPGTRLGQSLMRRDREDRTQEALKRA